MGSVDGGGGGGTVQFCSINEVGLLGEVDSSTCQEKGSELFQLQWETSLEPEIKGQTPIVSGNYVFHSSTNCVSTWRIEINPNYIDHQTKQRFLSMYLTLVKPPDGIDVVGVIYNFLLLDSEVNSPDNLGLQQYGRWSGLTNFSKEHPTHGFPDFIPYISLGPYTNPTLKEKMKIGLRLHIFHDCNGQAELPFCQIQEKFEEPLPFDVNDELELDGSIRFGNDVLKVDTKRISHFTAFFDKYIVRDSTNRLRSSREKELPDLAKVAVFDNSKTLVLRIIEFCHTGKLSRIPKRLQGLGNMLQAAIHAEIIQLKDLCQNEILENRITVESFTDIVELAKKDCFDESPAFEVLYGFLMDNIAELDGNLRYGETYVENKDFYEKLMIYNELNLPEMMNALASDLARGDEDSSDQSSDSQQAYLE